MANTFLRLFSSWDIIRNLLLMLPFFTGLAFYERKRTDRVWVRNLNLSPYIFSLADCFLLMLSPLLLLAYKDWRSALAAAGIVCLIPLVPRKQVRMAVILPLGRWLGWKHPDLIHTIRTRWPYFAVAYILTFRYQHSYFFIPVCLIFTALFLTSASTVNEPLLILLSYRQDVRTFLRNRIILFFKWWMILVSPLILLYEIYHPAYFPVLLFCSYAGFAILSFSVLFKYAGYYPMRAVTMPDKVLLSCLLIVVMVNPLFLPLAGYLFYRYYAKAAYNLNKFLYAEG